MHSSRAAEESGTHCVELAGEYDLTRRAELKLLFGGLPDNTPAMIDLSRVTYVDSTFLSELASLHFRLNTHRVTLVGANASIRSLLGIVKFDQLFCIAEL